MTTITRRFALLLALSAIAGSFHAGSAFAGAATKHVAPVSADASVTDVAYVYGKDVTARTDMRDFLVAKGFTFTSFRKGQVARQNLSSFDVVIVAADSDTNCFDGWDPDDSAKLVQSGLPLVGMGEGGGCMFDEVAPAIGWSTGRFSEIAATQVIDPADPVWTGVGTTGGVATVYTVPVRTLSIYSPTGAGVVALGGEVGSSEPYFPFVRSTEPGRTLWGFAGSPSLMTADGQQLFLNTIAPSA